MGNKRRIAFALLSVVLFIGLLWFTLRDRETVYQGKTVTQYLDEYATNYLRATDATSLRPIYYMGPRAIPYLRRALRQKNSAREKTLAFLQSKLPGPIARRLPAPKNPMYWNGLSAAAAHGLAFFGPTARDAIPDLLNCLQDQGTMNMAIYAILEIGPRPEDMPAFLSLLNSTNLSAQTYAADCLGRIGVASPEVLAALTKLASNQTTEPYLRRGTIRALGELGPGAISAETVLAGNLADPLASVRIASASALWKVRGKTNAPVALLTRALDDEIHRSSPPSTDPNSFGDHEINLLTLVGMLSELGSQAQPSVPLLRLVKEEKNDLLRLSTADALWVINQETNGLPRVYVEALKHYDPNRRLTAAEFLSDYCVKAQLNLPELKEMLASKDSFVQFFSARALWKLDGEVDTTLPALITGLEDHFTYYRNKDIRQLAAETLGEMGPAAKPAVPALLIALNDGHEKVRLAATNALKQIDPAAAAKAGIR